MLQFCDAGVQYDVSKCGMSTASLSKILIKDGTVVNAHMQEIADVYIEDGIIVAVKPYIEVCCCIIIIFNSVFVIARKYNCNFDPMTLCRDRVSLK